ncbi:Claudin-20 [Bagarius yarrelli]|uniref:Claudin-20 n=1 Tax=Bagarius yarrelli TaxID=175774 RepID=A0A556VA78_BAGYA|nr:Claudin-20 [Bagarius yarrelli]
MASTGTQIFGFVLALLGILGATVATLLPNWKVSADVGSSIITVISQMQGLWMDCTWYSTGMFSCTLKYSVLALPAYLQTARTTMVLSCVLAALGLCLGSLGLKCTHWGGGRRAKRHAALAAGFCFVASGFLCLVPASWYTNEVIASFLDASIPESNKFEPGGAVYVAFVSSGLFWLAAYLLPVVLRNATAPRISSCCLQINSYSSSNSSSSNSSTSTSSSTSTALSHLWIIRLDTACRTTSNGKAVKQDYDCDMLILPLYSQPIVWNPKGSERTVCLLSELVLMPSALLSLEFFYPTRSELAERLARWMAQRILPFQQIPTGEHGSARLLPIAGILAC